MEKSSHLKPKKWENKPPKTGPTATPKLRTKVYVRCHAQMANSLGSLTGLVEADEATSLRWGDNILDDAVS